MKGEEGDAGAEGAARSEAPRRRRARARPDAGDEPRRREEARPPLSRELLRGYGFYVGLVMCAVSGTTISK